MMHNYEMTNVFGHLKLGLYLRLVLKFQGNLMIKTLDNIWKSKIFTPICFVNASHFCNLHLFMYTCVQYNFYIRWYSYHLTVTQWVPVVEQELSTLSEHLNSAPIFPVAQYLVLCGMICGPLFVFSLGHCIVCPSFDL